MEKQTERYSEKEAVQEGAEMSDLVGERGGTEDYGAAEELLEEASAKDNAEEKKQFDITPGETPEEKEWDISAPAESELPAESASFSQEAEEIKKDETMGGGKRYSPSYVYSPSSSGFNKAEIRPIAISENYVKSEYDTPERAPEEGYEDFDITPKEATNEDEFKIELEGNIEKLPEKDRVSLARGFLGLGYRVEEFKGKTFSKVFKSATKAFKNKSFGKRLFKEYEEIYDGVAQRAHNDRETFNKKGGTVRGLSSAAMLVGNVVKYGRIAADVTFANPLRNVTVAAMFAGRAGEAVKGAHLKSEDVIEKGRVHDVDMAEDEAHKLYEEAKEKSGDGEVTKEHLMQTYKERLPQDLIERLTRDAGDEGFITKYAQRIAHKDIERSAQKIQGKLDEIENNTALSNTERENAKAHITARYDKFLRDMDRIVGNSGAVDMISYGSRIVEKGGKGLATVMVVETLLEGAYRGAEAFGAFKDDIDGIKGSVLENPPVIPNNSDVIKGTFGSFSEKMLREVPGVAPDDVDLAKQAASLGLVARDFNEFQGDTVQLSSLMNGVKELSIGGDKNNIMKAILENPESAEKLDNASIRGILSTGAMSLGHEQAMLNAEKVGVIGKGGNISETLGISMLLDAKVTVVSPDGTELEYFDANLVHQGDMVVQNTDGTVTVFKTSDVTVGPEHSLQGVYDSIKEGLDEKGIPSEVQNALNQGEGHWEGQISRAEAGEIEETWNSLKADFDTLDEEGKKAFLGTLSKGMTGEDMSQALHEQLASGQELTTEEIPPDVREQFIEAEGKRMAVETMEKVYTPEQIENAKIPGETDGPPIDGKTPEERIAPDAWSESIRKGDRYEVHDDVLDDDIEPREQTEAPSHEVAPPEHLPETPAHAEGPFVAEKIGAHEYSYKDADGDLKGKFFYNEKNEVIDFQQLGGPKLGRYQEFRESVLKDGWRGEFNKGSIRDSMALRKIPNDAYEVAMKQHVLDAMEKVGDKDTKEYQFLKKTIATRIERLEKTYGDIFK
ncbi:MAG: hypothetical protein NUV61_02980 [Candidatus Azambacteria bacterium]|nr:hypothetical protein [Candidatus Azambacteria bacterium]